MLCFTKQRIALFFALLWGFYNNIYHFLPAILTEIFTVFIITSFVYSLSLYYVNKKPRQLIISGAVLGLIILTKVIFAYVVLACLVICVGYLVIKKDKSHYKSSVYILIIALVVTIPYQAYTYKLTGRLFYWGNAGGMSLYWMSSPYELEYGDWKMPTLTNSLSPMPFKTTEGDSMLRANHLNNFNSFLSHEGVEQDDLFKKAAIANIKHKPKKFVRNYLYNLSRMLFDFPYSYSYQITQTITNILIGSLILWASAIASLISLLNWKRLIYPVKFTLLLFVVYFFTSGLLSAYARQFDVAVPILVFWIAFVIDRLPPIKLKFFSEK